MVKVSKVTFNEDSGDRTTEVIFESDGHTLTCASCGQQYRTLVGVLSHIDQAHAGDTGAGE